MLDAPTWFEMMFCGVGGNPAHADMDKILHIAHNHSELIFQRESKAKRVRSEM
jgi:hypothetical protein